MRRAAIIPFLSVALLGAGVASLALVSRIIIPQVENVRLDRLVCAACVLLSALCGLAGIFSLRAGSHNLAKVSSQDWMKAAAATLKIYQCVC